jgi:tRNA(His) 5'-end guanylyltransferase
LRDEGLSQATATTQLSGATTAAKHELLFARSIHFAHLPAWQRCGIGVFWEAFEKEGLDPRSGTTVMAERRRLRVKKDLPLKERYGEWLAKQLIGRGTE